MKKNILIITISILMTITVTAVSFRDVPRDHWAYDDIKVLSDAGIIRGNNFNGDEKATRYYFATAISRIFDKYSSGELKSDSISYAEYERMNRLAIEFANELNLFGYRIEKVSSTLRSLQKEVETYKEDNDYRKEPFEREITNTYDWRLRYDDRNYTNRGNNFFTERQVEHTFGINTRIDYDEGLFLNSRFEHNWFHNVGAGSDWPSNSIISTMNITYESGMESIRAGRQFFNLGNALVFSNRSNGIRYESILNNDLDLIVAATKDSLNQPSSAFNNFFINLLKYQDSGVYNTYYLTSHNPNLFGNSTDILSSSTNTSNRINYAGLAYRKTDINFRWFGEIAMMDYADTVTDNINPGGGSDKISSQFAYQLGAVKTLNAKTDIRIIYTRFDDYYKPLNIDATLTQPDYDDQGYGINLINTSGFDSFFLRVENYLSNKARLSYSVEFINDNTTLGATDIADDRNIYSVNYSRPVGETDLRFEFKKIDVNSGTSSNSVKPAGYSTGIIDPTLPADEPYNQETYRLTMSYTF
ncbi:MAG: S-layer homology domain-containing protein [Candidatus Muiribacteriota bacterium]